MTAIQHLTSNDFAGAIKDKVCIIDFWAEWCGPCRMFGSILEELAKELPEDILVGKVDVDKDPNLAVQFGINSIPAIFILDHGKVAKSFIGVQSKETILAALQSL